MTDSYDPMKTPDPKEWLAIDSQVRIHFVEEYHKKARIALPNRTVHAAMHAVVENQLAEGIPVVQDALSRLMADGLDRHDAIHAIAWVLTEHMWCLMNNDPMGDNPNERYFQAVRSLTVKKWLDSVK